MKHHKCLLYTYMSLLNTHLDSPKSKVLLSCSAALYLQHWQCVVSTTVQLGTQSSLTPSLPDLVQHMRDKKGSLVRHKQMAYYNYHTAKPSITTYSELLTLWDPLGLSDHLYGLLIQILKLIRVIACLGIIIITRHPSYPRIRAYITHVIFDTRPPYFAHVR